MVSFVVFCVLAVFASTGVDCEYYSEQSYSITTGDGKTHTLTKIDDNGKKELTSSRIGSDGKQQVLHHVSNNGDQGAQGAQGVHAQHAVFSDQSDKFQQVEDRFEQFQQKMDSGFLNPFRILDEPDKNDDDDDFW